MKRKLSVLLLAIVMMVALIPSMTLVALADDDAPTAVSNLVYNGEKQTLITNIQEYTEPECKKNAEFTFYQYKLDAWGADWVSQQVGTTTVQDAIKAKDAGTYTIYYRLVTCSADFKILKMKYEWKYSNGKSASIKATIAKKPINDADVTVDSIELQEPGVAVKPSKSNVTVVASGEDGKSIKLDTDEFSITCEESAETGPHNITVTANNNTNFTGEKTVDWTAVPATKAFIRLGNGVSNGSIKIDKSQLKTDSSVKVDPAASFTVTANPGNNRLAKSLVLKAENGNVVAGETNTFANELTVDASILNAGEVYYATADFVEPSLKSDIVIPFKVDKEGNTVDFDWDEVAKQIFEGVENVPADFFNGATWKKIYYDVGNAGLKWENLDFVPATSHYTAAYHSFGKSNGNDGTWNANQTESIYISYNGISVSGDIKVGNPTHYTLVLDDTSLASLKFDGSIASIKKFTTGSDPTIIVNKVAEDYYLNGVALYDGSTQIGGLYTGKNFQVEDESLILGRTYTLRPIYEEIEVDIDNRIVINEYNIAGGKILKASTETHDKYLERVENEILSYVEKKSPKAFFDKATATIEYDYGPGWDTLDRDFELGSFTKHAFGFLGAVTTNKVISPAEHICIKYEDENGYNTTIFTYVDFRDTRTATKLECDGAVHVTYGYTEGDLTDAILAKLRVKTDDDAATAVAYKESDITIDFAQYDAAEEAQQIKVTYAGNDDYKDCSDEIDIFVDRQDSEIEVDKLEMEYGDDETQEVTALSEENKALDYITMTLGTENAEEVEPVEEIEEETTEEAAEEEAEVITEAPMLAAPLNHEKAATALVLTMEPSADSLLRKTPGKALKQYLDRQYPERRQSLTEAGIEALLDRWFGGKTIYETLQENVGTQERSVEDVTKGLTAFGAILKTPIGRTTTIGDVLRIDPKFVATLANEIKTRAEAADANILMIKFDSQPTEVGNYWTTAVLTNRNYRYKWATAAFNILKKQEELVFDEEFAENTALNAEQEEMLDSAVESVEGIHDKSLLKIDNQKRQKVAAFNIADAETANFGGKSKSGNISSSSIRYLFIGRTFEGDRVVAYSKKNAPRKPGVYLEVIYTVDKHHWTLPIARLYVVTKYSTFTEIECYRDDNGDWKKAHKSPFNGAYNFTYEDAYNFKTTVTAAGGDTIDSKLVNFLYVSWDENENKMDVDGAVELALGRRTDFGTTSEPTEAGKYLVIATYLGNWRHLPSYDTCFLVIHKQDIMPSVKINDWIYGGYSAAYNTPIVTGTYENPDITFQYADAGRSNWSSKVPTEVGSYRVRAIVEETKNYKGAVCYADFAILAREAGAFVINNIDDQLYTGEALTPAVTVLGLNGPLVEGTDYTLTYENNINAGTATVHVAFMGNYTGEATVNFRIYGQPKSVLRAKATSSGSTAKITWNKVDGATKYVVYGSKCGKNFKKIKKVSGTSLTVKKIAGKKLQAHKTYKFKVVALDASGKKLTESKAMHIIVGKTKGKYANVTKITAKEAEVTLTAGESVKIGATVKVYKGMKHVTDDHGSKLRFTSNNPEVAKVDAKGNVTGVQAGTATIFIQDTNGMSCKTVVTVQ